MTDKFTNGGPECGRWGLGGKPCIRLRTGSLDSARCDPGRIQDLAIGQTQHGDTQVALQNRLAVGIPGGNRRIEVDAAIHFDAQASSRAVEVQHERAERFLPNKPPAAAPSPAHQIPQRSLGRRRALPQITRHRDHDPAIPPFHWTKFKFADRREKHDGRTIGRQEGGDPGRRWLEQVELTGPRQALDEAGAQTQIVSPAQGQVKAWDTKDWGKTFPVDVPLDGARPDDYDALLLPGGVQNPDRLRTIPEAVQFVKAFFEAGKPVAAICHGPWTLIEAGVVKGVKMTSWPSLQTDLRNAGADWVDEQIVTDGGLVTSRKPDDIPAFCAKIIEEFAEGRHQDQAQKAA